jgi:hypothetical protein
MSDGIDLDVVDRRRIVNEMNVSFGILRFTPATEYTPSDIFSCCMPTSITRST